MQKSMDSMQIFFYVISAFQVFVLNVHNIWNSNILFF